MQAESEAGSGGGVRVVPRAISRLAGCGWATGHLPIPAPLSGVVSLNLFHLAAISPFRPAILQWRTGDLVLPKYAPALARVHLVDLQFNYACDASIFVERKETRICRARSFATKPVFRPILLLPPPNYPGQLRCRSATFRIGVGAHSRLCPFPKA